MNLGLHFAGGALLAAVMSFTLPGAAYAVDDDYNACMDSSDGTNVAWGECGSEYLDRVDSQLNATWKAVFPTLGDEEKDLLRAEQRAWNDFKEVSCLYYTTGYYGREGQVLEYPACRGDIIEQRIDYLNALSE